MYNTHTYMHECTHMLMHACIHTHSHTVRRSLSKYLPLGNGQRRVMGVEGRGCFREVAGRYALALVAGAGAGGLAVTSQQGLPVRAHVWGTDLWEPWEACVLQPAVS